MNQHNRSYRASAFSLMALVVCLVAGLAVGETAKASDKVPKPAATAEKDKSAAPKDDAKKSAPVTTAKTKSKPKDLSAEVAALRSEVAALRKKVEKTLDILVKDLVAENTYLREKLGRYEGSNMPAAVPRPGEDAMEDAPGPAEEAAPAPPPEPVSTVKEMTTLAEWGRTPEEAVARGGDTTSLKGMIIVVPPDMDESALAELGRKLRKDFDAYDNINIELFNEVNAAQAFADTNRMSEHRHVLSISRHKPSGRDEVMLMRDGKPSPVEPEKK